MPKIQFKYLTFLLDLKVLESEGVKETPEIIPKKGERGVSFKDKCLGTLV